MTGYPDGGLAATKLVPPTLPDRLVQRSRLTDRLDAGLAGQVRLVLASAPAGSGKSRLLRWLTAPYRSRVLNFASKPFYTVADRIPGRVRSTSGDP